MSRAMASMPQDAAPLVEFFKLFGPHARFVTERMSAIALTSLFDETVRLLTEQGRADLVDERAPAFAPTLVASILKAMSNAGWHQHFRPKFLGEMLVEPTFDSVMGSLEAPPALA